MIGAKHLAAVAAASLFLALPEAVLAQAPHPAQPPLKPGRSAGVHGAQQSRVGLALIGSGAIIAVVIVAATASNGGGNNNNQMSPQFAPSTTAP